MIAIQYSREREFIVQVRDLLRNNRVVLVEGLTSRRETLARRLKTAGIYAGVWTGGERQVYIKRRSSMNNNVEACKCGHPANHHYACGCIPDLLHPGLCVCKLTYLQVLIEAGVRICANPACGWQGHESECYTFKHSHGELLCPVCHEMTE